MGGLGKAYVVVEGNWWQCISHPDVQHVDLLGNCVDIHPDSNAEACGCGHKPRRRLSDCGDNSRGHMHSDLVREHRWVLVQGRGRSAVRFVGSLSLLQSRRCVLPLFSGVRCSGDVHTSHPRDWQSFLFFQRWMGELQVKQAMVCLGFGLSQRLAVRVSTNESLSCIISMGSKPVVTFATPCGRTWSVYRNQNTRTTLEHLVRLM